MFRPITLLSLILLLLAGALVAQDTDQATPPSSSSTMRKKQGVHADRAELRLKRLSKRLSLTDDQKQKLLPILQDEEKQMKTVEDDTSLTQQQKHRKMRDVRMASRSQMDSILTDDQKQKLGPAGQHAGQHHGRHNHTSAGSPPTSQDQTSPQ